MFTVKIDGFSFQYLAPDMGELRRGLVAFFVIQVQTFRRQFIRIAAGNQIKQCPAIGKTIQRRCLACRQSGRNNAGAQGYQKFQSLGDRDQRSGHQPGVFTGAAGRDQHATKTQSIGRLGDLL
ncbi:hypothetical protein D3C78_1413010 [compost metagenome]